MKHSLYTEIHSRLVEIGISKQFRPGQIIQFQDDYVDDIYVVEDGAAAARYFEINGKESWIDSFNRGDMIGAEHIQTGGPSQCQIIARSNVSVLQFKRTNFAELILSDKKLNSFVIEQLISRLKRHQQVRLESHMLSKRGRVASEIRRMAEPSATVNQGYIVTPKPVISDMAMRLGIARETVSRTVSDLVKSDIIERSRNAFFVPDLTLLEAEMR